MSRALFLFAGIMFAVYPIVRPYSDETSLAGADAFASPQWIIAHVCAMLGFIALALAVNATVAALGDSTSGRVATVSTWVGVGLTLPYYGAETFALNALGGRAQQDSDVGLMTLADPIRYAVVPATMFALGLLLVAVGSVAFAWTSGPVAGWTGGVLAAGFVLFLPQFYGPPIVRIAHGVLILVGCILVARVRYQPSSTMTGA